MTARPYDIVAYSPAASSEFRATTTNFCTVATPAPAGGSLGGGDGCHRVAGLAVLRPDQVHLPAGLVLGHPEREVRLSRLGEAEHLAGDDALLQLQPGERCADLLRLQRPGLGDGGEERLRRLVGHRVVPLRIGLGGLLVAFV